MVKSTLPGLAATALFAAAAASAAPLAVENFEAAAVPTGWTADAGGELRIASERFKSGRQSLCWLWHTRGSTLTGRAPGRVLMAENRGLAFWLYSEKPMERILRLELLDRGSVVGRCWYVLNFRGWRPLGAPYRQVCLHPENLAAEGASRPACSGFRLIVAALPAEADGPASGRVYIDFVNFRCPDHLRADHQQPWAGRPEILHTATPEKFIYSSHDISQNRPWLPRLVPEDRITPEERAGMSTLCERQPLPKGCIPRPDPTALDDFRNVCQIRRSADGVLSGRPIVPPRDGFNIPPDGIILYDRLNPARPWRPVSEESPAGVVLNERLSTAKGKPASQPPPGGMIYDRPLTAVGASRAGVPMMQRLAEAYFDALRRKHSEESAALKQAFFDLCDHLLDQGFAEGNGNSASWCFPTGPLIGMREELGKAGRLRDMSLACLALGTSYSDGVLTVEDWRKPDILGSPRNTDGFGNYTEILRFILLLPDASQRMQRLYAYRRSVSLLCDPQLGEPYAWDGTCHHHIMFHPGYSAGALVPQALSLKDTCFRLTPEAVGMLKRSMSMLAFMGGAKGILPANCPGYTGVPLGIYSRLDILGQFATVGTAESVRGVDPEIAGIYLAFYADDPNPPELVKQFQSLGLSPYKPGGHVSVNGAVIALHRRDNWLVSIAGKYRFRRGLEPNYTGSLFNHYCRSGSVFVVSCGNPVSPWSSGFSLEGWDARHYPGTTCYLGESAKSLLCRSRGHSENRFGGGTDLDGDGIWGMNSIGQTNPLLVRSGNITFTKSAFCFGNRITLITTGVGRCALAEDEERSLELATTLWQNAFGSGGRVGNQNLRLGFNTPVKPPPTPPAQEPCWVNGEQIGDFPWAASLPPGPAHWLVDNKGTGYYIHPGAPPIRLARRHQAWTYPSSYLMKKTPVNKDPNDLQNYEPTEGDFSVAWFEHGVKPDMPECAYTLVPDTTPEAVSRFARAMAEADPPYRILQKDARAHVLRDRDSKTTGYVVFDPGWKSPTTILQTVNRPCAVMIKEVERRLRVSVASTDMDSWLQEIRLSGEIVLTLSGEWKLDSADARVTRETDRTILRIPYRTFMPVVLTLERARP